MTVKRFSIATLVLAAFFIAVTNSPAPADVVTFDHDTDRNWDNPANWFDGVGDPATIPGAADDAVVPDVSSSVRIPIDVGTVNSVRVGGGGGNESVQVRTGGALIISTDLLLGIVEGTSNRSGDFTVGQGNVDATLTVNGNIVANSPGDNDLTINNGTLNLAGDIVMMDGNRIDKLNFQRGTLNLTGLGAQTLTVQEFDLNATGNNNSSATFTLSADKTLITTNSGDVSDIARMGNNNDRTNTATLNIHGGTADFAGHLRVGSTNDDPDPASQGFINVGDGLGSGGILVANRELRLGEGRAGSDGPKFTSGDLNLLDATSVVTIHSDIKMTMDVSTEWGLATITIDDGLLTQTSGDILNGGGLATLNLNGGVLHLAATDSTVRSVDTLNFVGGELRLAVYLGMPALTATDMTLAAGLGGSVIDLTTTPDSAASTTEQTVWDGLTAEWDADASKWNPDILPAELISIQPGDQFTILGSTNPIVNQGNAALSAAAAVDWSLNQDSPTETIITRTGAAVPLGPGVAVIDDVASIVGRTTDLSIQSAPGVGADASQLEISNGSLTLSGGSDLIIGGVAQGIVNQTSGDVAIDGILQFGQTVDGEGGTYNLDAGTLTITGVDANGNSIAEKDAAVNRAQMQINGGTLSVAGNILTQRFSVGEVATSDGATYTIAAGKTIETTGTTAVGTDGTNAVLNIAGSLIANDVKIASQAGGSGTMNVNGGSVLATGDDFRVADGGTGTIHIMGDSTVTVGGGNFEVSESGTGIFIMDGGTLFQNTNNFIWGQAAASDATVTLNGGTIDLRGDLGQNLGGDSGHFRINQGEGSDGLNVNTADLLGGAVIMGARGDLSMTSKGAATAILTIDGAEVTVGDDVEYRNNGTDTILFKSGLLDLTTRDGNDTADGAPGEFHLADRTGTNVFTWTGGTMMDASKFFGDLAQNNTDSPSLLKIGGDAGTMDVTGAYDLTGGTLEIELFAQGETAGTDFDLLTVAGTATLAGLVEVLDQSGGLIDTGVAFQWNVLEADEIELTGAINLPEGVFYEVLNDFNGGTTDMLQLSTAVIPEPGSIALLAIAGLIGLLTIRRRKS